MNTALRQTVTVQPGGVVHFASPELQEGTEAEVIVLVPAASPTVEPARRLAAFQSLQQSLGLTQAMAAQWIREAEAERKVFGAA